MCKNNLAKAVFAGDAVPAFGARGGKRFKDFAPLALSAKPIYDEYAGRLTEPLTSPLYFQSLYAWNFTSVSKYAIFYDHLCIVAHDTIHDDTFAFPPIGDCRPETFSKAVCAVCEEFASEGLECVFMETPDFMLPYFSSLPHCEADISHNTDWSDYVFTREAFVAGIGKSSSREAIRGFVRKRRPVVRALSSSDGDKITAITEMDYCLERNCAECFCGCEVEVARRLVSAYDELELSGIVIESDDDPLAFGITCFQKHTIHFISKKARRSVRGLNEFLNAELMERFGLGCESVNYSDDMGNAGLRFYKSRLGAYALSHRNTVRLRCRTRGGAR
ncbi:MAG: phosphatidylglycerol lysyltransferase domain-containing protein [Synergistaceae bacterium]|nr:phosphatidylglycerol lysyltransferase domain-containing protein [Synergistaceae bacterium]